MFLHYLKLAWRNLVTRKVFSLINLLGITIGLTSCLIIGLYVYQEFSYDRFYGDHARIYRVNKKTNEKGKLSQQDGITPGQLAPAIAKELPDVAEAGRFRPWFNDMLVSRDTTRFLLKNAAYADQSFLNLFDFPLLLGKKSTALTDPFTAVITESTARKYFGQANPLGQKIKTLNDIEVVVSAVARDLPANSSIQFSMLISWPTISAPAAANYFSWMDTWNTQVDFTFLKLQPGARMKTVEQKISTLMHAHFAEKEFTYSPYLQPLDEIHLWSANILYADAFAGNNGKIVVTLLIIALFILAIASFNFINLTTAGALGRAKETGVQKVLGAKKYQLVVKFFIETALLLVIALCASLLLTVLLLPYFNQIANSQIQPTLLLSKQVMGLLAALMIVLAFIAGLYPALFLTRFKSSDVFRNIIKAGKDGWLRKSLVTIQFALSILLIIATIVVNRQTHFLASKDLGFNKDQVLVVQLTNTQMEKHVNEYTQLLKQNPGVLSASVTNRVPGQGFNGYGVIPEGYHLEDHIMANVLETDADFTGTYDVQMVEGRYFSPLIPSDTAQAVVINEAMARELHWKTAVGKNFEIYEATKGRVIGVVKDFNFASLRENVRPLAIMLRANPLYLSVKLRSGNMASTVNWVQQQWKKFDQEDPINYFFIDEQMNHYYESDQRLLQVLSIFAGLAIFIAAFGLYGLSLYSIRQRVKEIGIRKILGAPVGRLVLMLSGDFLKLVTLAAIIAFPIAWVTMNGWLQDFAYRVNIGVWIFLVAGGAAVLIAVLTVGFHALRAARSNPVQNLRTE